MIKEAALEVAREESGTRPALRPEFPDSPGFVLTTASALGSLAAVRCLGERGIPVFVLDAQRFAPAAWSRHVVRREVMPKVRPVGQFIEALAAFGARNPGHVLYASSDDLAWAFAERETLLRRSFRLLTPAFACVARLLDKRELYAACGDAGIPVPHTWFPESLEDVDRASKAARFPVIVKPRSQVFFTSARKGVLVSSPRDLRWRYAAFAHDNRYEDAISLERPCIARPMIQELHTSEPLYSISGFCDPRRGLFVARAARKVLQWPRRAGVGIAFEDAPLETALAEGLRRLCELTGFFGIFEAEFVCASDGMRLIDFNPRLFNQIAFDVERGLPSPYFAYLLAVGDADRLESAVHAAQDLRFAGGAVFKHAAMIAWTRAAERIVGRTPEAVPSAMRNGASIVVDAATDAQDWVPGIVESLQQVTRALQHPRSTLRAAARGYG
jgi:predicted ATP-grasp superfamily ATP-dependent carboligase